MSERSRGLGRGLSALLGDVETPAPATPPPAATQSRKGPANLGAASPFARVDETPYIAIELLRRNPEQPRRHFADTEISELANSIKEKGVLQPILVRPAPGAPGRVADRRRGAPLARGPARRPAERSGHRPRARRP
jgi:ParB family chromosome partitioning protein